jgi:Uma2 family endonuclease
MPIPSRGAKFTYSDYASWPEGERWELIGGEAYYMTPAPTSRHQRVAGRFFYLLEGALQGGACTAYFAPVDVVLSECDVVQPDLFVVCDRQKITATSIEGAPEVVIEILSPGTALKDRREKKELYERYGVREYVLADPEAGYVERFVLGEDGTYGAGQVLGPTQVLEFESLGGLRIHLKEVFRSDDVNPASPSSSGPPD